MGTSAGRVQGCEVSLGLSAIDVFFVESSIKCNDPREFGTGPNERQVSRKIFCSMK